MGRALTPAVEDYLGRRARVYGGERAVLAHVLPPGEDGTEHLEEMVSLARTAGVTVVDTAVQHRRRSHPATFLGPGKAHQIRDQARDVGADTLVLGAEVSPAQARNLEERTGLKVVDRTQLILDIFAQHAGTREAALAVELAQLEYLLPRLRGWGQALTDPGGGIGTSGPGETRLEQGGRTIRRRIQAVRRELGKVTQDREVQAARRRRAGVPLVAIVGYTNSGKSTLFNRLTGADALVEDKLFATLDTRIRRLSLPRGVVLLTDTVGFIRDLPHQLVPAFQATLGAVRDAAALLIVLDASAPGAADHLRVVRGVVAEVLGPDRAFPPVIHVLNKLDLVSTPEARARLEALRREVHPHVAVSAKTGENIPALIEAFRVLLSGSPLSVTAG